MSEDYKPETGNNENDPEREAPKAVSFKILEGKPIVTYTLIGITALVFALQAISEWRYRIDWPMQLGANYGPYITYYHEYWRLITPIFLHGSITHIVFNMYALFTLGPSLEHYYGHLDFLRFYLICGFAGNVLSYIADPGTASVGASTALFGLIAAQAMFLYKNKRLLKNYRRALQNIGFVILINLMLGLRGGIDNWGHLGGLLGGLLVSWLCGPEIAVFFDPQTQKALVLDTVPRSRREISFLLCTLFFAAAAFAFGR